MTKLKILIILLLFCGNAFGLNSSIIYLDKAEQHNLQRLYAENAEVKRMCDSIISDADRYLLAEPNPIAKINYEGLLEINPLRIKAMKSLADIDITSGFIYAYYCTGNPKYLHAIKKYVVAWAQVYQPDGNTINENKFTPLFWGYYVAQSDFSAKEQRVVESWITKIAQKQIDRPSTPNNNWMAKRHRLIGLAGGITQNQELIDFATAGFKEYINTSYFADGTSRDLKTRDAMHYHISGIKVVLDALVNLSTFGEAFNLYHYSGASGSSMALSVAFTYPYATGEKQHKEWVNTTVQLDKERAAAGLKEYQPGMLFDKREAIPMFEYACFFDKKYYAVLSKPPHNYTVSWPALLNSPWVREK